MKASCVLNIMAPFFLNKLNIYERFKSLIEQGELRVNEQLPSIRQLAECLHVSRNTTLTAYEQLAPESYINGKIRKGYLVNKLEPQLFSRETPVVPPKP